MSSSHKNRIKKPFKLRIGKRKISLSNVFIILAILCVAIGIGISLSQKRSNEVAVQQAQADPSAPSIVKPTTSDIDSYKVPADAPRIITISKLSVRAKIMPLGLDKDNIIKSPANVYDAGWYNASAKPGQAGAMLIDGHTASSNTEGIFININKLKAGDQIKIEKGDGTIVSYTVVSTTTYDAKSVDMIALLSPINKSRPGLNLISCIGNVAKGTNDFDKRIVVYSELSK